ncbi:Glu/Leu/Phe/Val dehydrogenase dimerization domain-containing protein [Zobellella maritima]|uniref:Glu/Leu/Phe/Val dehydrogenase dimerization domain-containing protein n=1 Tax=Zobellella maritima TaxID=2059725 RepID=UPI000E301768|nr:Glu/Leu/Phe/Val dehydrogenase dimerization domain-containing protein [Zobellella maritima]
MKTLLKQFEQKKPEIVFEWHDSETEAKGWVVINSLRGGAAGGGTRMRKGLDRHEVESLAKTMEVKFAVSGPAIGGAKSGIDFDPRDPRRDGVLDRWFKAVAPLLKAYYGTGGDLNVCEVKDVVPLTERYGLWHPQEGVVNGHYHPGVSEQIQKLGQLRLGVAKIVEDGRYTPEPERKYKVADLITGWGLAESVRHYYGIYGGELAGKRVIVQGFGNVGATAAYYLAREGASVVGIIDASGGVICQQGLGFEQLKRLYLDKQGNKLVGSEVVSFEQAQDALWRLQADIFLPCAASRLVSQAHLDALIEGGVELISCGANVPFQDQEIFYGPVYQNADERLSVIPDFIANCGMARAFAFLMQTDGDITDEAIFEDVSRRIGDALQRVHNTSSKQTRIAATAFEDTLRELVD